jgi:AraC-like DNA-binding protein
LRLPECTAIDIERCKGAHDIPSIANKVKLNDNRLKYVFSQVFKISIYQFLLGARMEKAKLMLQQTNATMKEIVKD